MISFSPFCPRVLFDYANIKASIKGYCGWAIGNRLWVRQISNREKNKNRRKKAWMITNDRKVNTTMWYIMSTIIPDFWNNKKFCQILVC